jgi:nitrile hydratase
VVFAEYHVAGETDMNGVHDMGGMTCFGPIVREENEPIFHAPWERRMFAMGMLGLGGIGTLDEYRHAIERMDPAHYLESPYYEHWLAALETLAVEHGLLTKEELATGLPQTTQRREEPPLPPEAIPIVVSKGAPCDRPAGRRKPRFSVGDTVTAKNLNPSGHTRLPRYVRGKQGVIHLVHGTFVYPDTNAHGGGEKPQPLYNVCFSARELWGPASARRDHLYIDLWEDYLEPVNAPAVKTKTVKKASARTAKSTRTKTKTTAKSQRKR